MGEVDIAKLMEIYVFVLDFCKGRNIFFRFAVDEGKFETAIEFISFTEAVHPPISSSWTALRKNGNAIYVPDLLDFPNKIIIEYEEESKPMKGPKIIKKGHSEESTVDMLRDKFYKDAGFRLFKVWESDIEWKKKLGEFLLRCNA